MLKKYNKDLELSNQHHVKLNQYRVDMQAIHEQFVVLNKDQNK